MNIGSFVSGALEFWQQKHFDVALALACSSVDATAAKIYGDSLNNNKRYKQFLQKNMQVVTYFGFPGIIAGGIRIKCINVPDLKTDIDGLIGIEDIIYHIVRCGLIHQCEIDNRIRFTAQTIIGDFNNQFEIPENLILGLIMAVVLSECNKDESLSHEYEFSYFGKNYKINSLWGAKEIKVS